MYWQEQEIMMMIMMTWAIILYSLHCSGLVYVVSRTVCALRVV